MFKVYHVRLTLFPIKRRMSMILLGWVVVMVASVILICRNNNLIK